jgi:hypothetical protein
MHCSLQSRDLKHAGRFYVGMQVEGLELHHAWGCSVDGALYSPRPVIFPFSPQCSALGCSVQNVFQSPSAPVDNLQIASAGILMEPNTLIERIGQGVRRVACFEMYALQVKLGTD